MNSTKKGIISLVLLLAVGGIYFTQTGDNENLYQGQLLGNDSQQSNLNEDQNGQADLSPELKVIVPEDPNEDISLEVSISNIGSANVTGETGFKYTLFLNDEEIFSNSDSYTFMEPGDSFSFSYPVSRLIYNYGNTGSAKVLVDTEDAIKELNESNNEVEVSF